MKNIKITIITTKDDDHKEFQDVFLDKSIISAMQPNQVCYLVPDTTTDTTQYILNYINDDWYRTTSIGTYNNRGQVIDALVEIINSAVYKAEI
ncbi:hypothetical protein K144316041_p21250 (plasmid) [Clostridium tetani]|uniref:hypothetical protein n=1 Tax=Clostridium tetani TaxID=1513 RepID=UPI0029547390|nr:hypothetical protein [Clostridium tetani]BDR74286.1 hypothetical protein K144316041_p21250 [Clostridium tetani]